jgi:hypothetical protein
MFLLSRQLSHLAILFLCRNYDDRLNTYFPAILFLAILFQAYFLA